jgi:hypothetical protein
MVEQLKENVSLQSKQDVKPAWRGDVSESGHTIHRLLSALTLGFWGGIWNLARSIRQGRNQR